MASVKRADLAFDDRTSVSTRDLVVLIRAVEWANFLNADASASDLLDPCSMLEALSEVYTAAHALVGGSTHWQGGLASGSAP
jgi:hypothetical protein